MCTSLFSVKGFVSERIICLMKKTLYIKNMVCQRCIIIVEADLESLDIPFEDVQLGQVNLTKLMDNEVKEKLGAKLESKGFEILEEVNSTLIDKIKTVIIEMVHYKDSLPKTNYSDYISDHVHKDYNYLSKLFSSVEGITIEKFIIKQKIEKVKELISYDQKPLKEIADDLNYSSVQHLSNQFKKELGLSPSEFRRLKRKDRKALDKLSD